MSTSTPSPNPVHPKVKAAAITMVILVVAVAVLNAITPNLLGFLGDWAPVGYTGVVALSGVLAGWIKKP